MEVETLNTQSACTGARLGGWLVVLLLGLGMTGCKPKVEDVPETPPDAVAAIVEGLENDQPQVVWHALPERYQTDVRGVIDEFCNHMDPQVYDRSWRIFQKFVRVLNEKEDFIFNSPELLSTAIFESNVTEHWGDLVQLMNAIAESELTSLESVRMMDPGEFLATTGHAVMSGSRELAEASGMNRGWNGAGRMTRRLGASDFEFVEQSETTGRLTITRPESSRTTEVEMSRVDGRWVPAAMASGWDDGIARAREGMEALSGDGFEKVKPMINMVLNTLEGGMEQLLNAKSQQEFDQTLKTLKTVGDLVQGMRNRTQ